jgi:hypothetical protein
MLKISLLVGEVNSEDCVFPCVIISISQGSKVEDFRKKLSLKITLANAQEYHTSKTEDYRL